MEKKFGQPKKINRLTIHNLLKKAFKHHWHPCSSAKTLEETPPVCVKRALGSYIEDMEGHLVIDGISSWWCKSLGHNHPRLKEALLQQANKFEHVIGTSTTHEAIIELSELLVTLNPGMGKVFYAGDGSSAVEIALKMSLYSRFNQGNTKKKGFLSLVNGYHGETCGALSVTQIDTFKRGYASLLFNGLPIENIPYVNTPQDPLWQDCQEHWDTIQDFLEKHHHKITALILEPIVQGAGNMRIYSQDFLRRLRIWTKEQDIHLIADEIMTGIGRTGKMFACEYAGITPDFMCLSKGLTSGWIPFSAVLTTNEIYNCISNKIGEDKVFCHSHTYSGNPLGAALALETLKIMKDDFAWDDFKEKTAYLLKSLQEVADETKTLSNVRGIGMIAAADIRLNLFSSDKMKSMIRLAYQNGALLRPLGKTLYWLPPLNIEKHTIEELKEITKRALLYAFK
ncbi:MAG: adenosylmethionine--8-amino-7-oxononanoate transaminase [Alphaproteobacteria bacterium]|nr:adenosylmethionine--8-amino-7-oxononanoate transaminase [Alphaproteobacteria bacterium]